MRNSKIKKKSMKKCVVDIRYHAAVGDYSRILVVLTSHQGERTDGRNKKKWNEQGSIHNLVYSYRDAAYKYGLWTAAGIMMEAGCSDDSFSDFRMWLIAQGKEVYLNALKDPDSLSGVTLYGYCSFEALGYISSQVYSAMKGKNIYQDSTARMQMECYEQVIRDIVYHPMIEYPLELPEAMVVYPKLCECHLSEQVRKAPQKVRTWNVSRTDIRRMMARGNAAIKKMQEQGQNTPEATRPVRKGTVR